MVARNEAANVAIVVAGTVQPLVHYKPVSVPPQWTLGESHTKVTMAYI
jgi:hypothetical protein